MAGLDDLDENVPAGSVTPTLGDDELRAIKAKTKEYSIAEHAGNGRHKFQKLATLPANDANSRRIIIKDNSGISLADELYYDTGTAWVKLTTNQDFIDYAASLTTHKAAATIDHPDNSVTHAKIAASAIVLKHVIGGVSVASIADVFNGSANGNIYHTHGDIFPGAPGTTVTITSTQAYAHPANAKALLIELFGGGAGGKNYAAGIHGGGGGSYVRLLVSTNTLPSSNTVTVTAGGTNGADGGDTTFGALLTAFGGKAGVGAGGVGGLWSKLVLSQLILSFFAVPGGNGVDGSNGGGGGGGGGDSGAGTSGGAGRYGGGNGGNQEAAGIPYGGGGGGSTSSTWYPGGAGGCKITPYI